MARQKMNFGVGINLDAKKFRKGANQVNGYLKGMKSHVLALSAAFGVGAIGMGNFFSKVFSTVKELNSVQTKLKNVTKTTTAYNDALKYLNDTAGTYKQNITTLIDNYANFVAASDGSGMAFGQIRDFFTSIVHVLT